jgi:hypothetical protein
MNTTLFDADILHIDINANLGNNSNNGLNGSILEKLREPRLNIFDVNISIFDLSGTLLISYIIARQFDLNVPLVMFASIPVGYLAHEFFKIETPLTNKINDIVKK